MKKLIIAIAILFVGLTATAQEYRPYLTAANDSAFKDKIRVAAYFGAKANVANVNTSPTVKRFSQIVLTEITQENPSWLVPLAFVILTVPELGAITTASPQANVNTVMNLAYPIFAKAWYKDISN